MRTTGDGENIQLSKMKHFPYLVVTPHRYTIKVQVKISNFTRDIKASKIESRNKIFFFF